MNLFKIAALFTAALFAYLFFTLLLNSEAFLTGLGLHSCATATILARRASMLMLGFSILLFASSNLPRSNARQAICLAVAITMAGLACMGSYELARGTVNSSMLIAISIETLVAMSFTLIFLKDKAD